jgi:hypothetical protein
VKRIPPGGGEEAAPYGNAALRRVLGLAPPDPPRLARAIRRRDSALFVAGTAAAELIAGVPLKPAFAIIAAAALAATGWRLHSTAIERQIGRGDRAGAEAAIGARAAQRGEDDARVLYLRGRLAQARVAAGDAGRREPYRWFGRAVAAGSGDALRALRDEAEAWECERRRMAARALAETRSPDALPILRLLGEREPRPTEAAAGARAKELPGAGRACGAGAIAREGIRVIEAARR